MLKKLLIFQGWKYTCKPYILCSNYRNFVWFFYCKYFNINCYACTLFVLTHILILIFSYFISKVFLYYAQLLILEHLFLSIHCISSDRSIISKLSKSSRSIRSIRSWKCQPDTLLFSRFHARFITHSTKGPSNRPRRPIQRFRRKTGDRQRSEAAAGQTSTTNNLSPTLTGLLVKSLRSVNVCGRWRSTSSGEQSRRERGRM